MVVFKYCIVHAVGTVLVISRHKKAAHIVKELFIHDVYVKASGASITLISEADLKLWWIKQFLWIKPALVLTHSGIKHLQSFCLSAPSLRMQASANHSIQNKGSAGRCQVLGTQQQDWSHRALVCCLAGISIVYYSNRHGTTHRHITGLSFSVTHPFAIAAAKKINTSVCHWQKHPKRSKNFMSGVVYLAAGRGWMAQSLQESWGRCRCWRETEGRASLERWGRSFLRCAAGRTLGRWRWEACEAHCDSGCGTAPADCAEGWTRCVVAPTPEEALRRDNNILNIILI